MNQNNVSENILHGLKKFYEEGMQTSEAFLLDHLSNDISRVSYIKKGQEMIKALPNGAQVLDWGAGFGQMTYILKQLGANVTAYDVIRRSKNLFNESNTQLIFGNDDYKLPFEDNSFDAVVGCGVLEHVPHIPGSLSEILRVLKPGGKFYIYNLPYILSPSELYAAIRKISVHPIRFTQSGTRQILEEAGFEVRNISFENGIPKRLSGPLKWFRFISDKLTRIFLFLDQVVASTPIVNLILSNSIKIMAVKPLNPQKAKLKYQFAT